MLKVNGKEIPQSAIEFELARLVRFYAQHLPEEQVRQQMNVLRERAKEQAIGARLLSDEAGQLDITVSDDELQERVAAFTAQAGGEARLGELLKKQNTTLDAFKEQIRHGRRMDKLVAKITSSVREPTDAEIEEHYRMHGDEYTASEQAQAQHILVSPANDSADAKLAAIAKMNDLRKKLQEGADFGDLAAGYSECPSGKEAGGSLGWFGRGAMVPEFDKVVFAMKDGEVSDIVETQFGFHLIKKTGHRDAERPSFESIREKIRDFLRHTLRGDAIAAHIADLRKKAVVEGI